MTISVIKTPNSIVCSKNPVRVILETDKFVLNAGRLASIDLLFANNPSADFAITYMGVEHVILFTPAPSASEPHEIITNVGALALDAYLQNVVIPSLNKIYLISSFYDVVWISAGRIRIVAKNTGPEYNIFAGLNYVPGLSFPATVTGITRTYRPNFKIYCDVFAETELGASKKIFSGEGIPDVQNRCEFFLEHVLKGHPTYDIPTFTGSLGLLLQGQSKRYYIRYAENYGDVQVTYHYNRYPADGYLIAILGAESYIKSFDESFFDTYFTAPSKFITSMPDGSSVHRQQHQFLSFFYPGIGYGSAASFRIQVKLKYTDNTESGWTNAGAVQAGNFEGRIVTARVGYDQLGIDAIKAVDKDVLSYQVRIVNLLGTVITEAMLFKVYQEYCRYPRFFMFINSFGYPEVMFFHGERTESVEMQNEIIKRQNVNNDPSTGVYYGEYAETNNQIQDEYSLNTGNKDRNYLLYFRDFLLSPLRFEQTESHYEQIVLAKQSIKMPSENDTLFNLKFNYTRAWMEVGNG